MTFPEGLTGHMQVIQATVQPIWRMDRPPPNIPMTIARAALHAPGRMRDARGRGRVESQRFAVQYRSINDIAHFITGHEHSAMVRWHMWGHEHGTHATRRLKAQRHEQ